ncbi:MAG TPA: hypothetical protein VK611_17025 [Acidimicrobiales bacterium]|nr:hypothetical protein [Acidimicrobiales bacterium]
MTGATDRQLDRHEVTCRVADAIEDTYGLGAALEFRHEAERAASRDELHEVVRRYLARLDGLDVGGSGR